MKGVGFYVESVRILYVRVCNNSNSECECSASNSKTSGTADLRYDSSRAVFGTQYDRRCFPYRCVRHTVTTGLILHPSTHLGLSVNGGAAESGSALP